MNFDDLTVIWNDQEKTPLFAFDKETLHEAMTRKHREFQRCQRRRDTTEVGVTLIALATMGWSFYAVSGSDDAAAGAGASDGLRYMLFGLGLAAAGWAVYSIYVLWKRKRFERRAARLDQSMEENLTSACEELNERARSIRFMLRWGIPYCFAVACLYVFTFFKMSGADGRAGLAVCLVMAAGIALEYRCTGKRLRGEVEPRLREIESLRERLREAKR
jgi:uncharacterized membrane protein (DUF485 family)